MDFDDLLSFEWFDDLDPVAAGLTLLMAAFIGWSMFFNPNQESVNQIPFFWRVAALLGSVPLGYYIAVKMINR